MEKTVKFFISSMILLFCISGLQAQYTVLKVTGEVEMSVDGKTWNPLKKKDELKESCQIKLLKNSSVKMVDSNYFVYSYANSKTVPETVSVVNIVKQRKTIFEAMNDKSEKRSAIGAAKREMADNKDETVYLRFYVEEFGWCDNDYWDKIPVGSVFYITIVNKTEEDKIVNVYQKLENEESISCFPEDILVEKNTSLEIKELLFVKQENNQFTVIPK